MTRTMLWSLAGAAMLAMLADGAANAQESRKRAGARCGHSGTAQFLFGDGHVRSVRPRLSGGQQTKYPPPKGSQILSAAKNLNAQAKDANKAKGPQYNPYVTVDVPGAGSAARLQRRTSRPRRTQNNLKQMALPMHNYEHTGK